MVLKAAFEKLFRIREETQARRRPGADSGYDPYEKPFLDHLEDLRHTLIKIALVLGVFTILAFTFHIQIFQMFQLPARMTNVAPGVSLWDRIEFITLSPPEMLMLMLKVSFFAGIVVSFPVIIYFLFEFILPGLREVEKKAIIPGAMVGFALFLVGVCFAFFLAAPIALRFFYTFENSRISQLNPSKEAMEKPLATFPLIGLDGKEYEPATERDPARDAEAGESLAGPLTPQMRDSIRTYVGELFAVQQGTNLALRYDDTRDKIVILQVKGGSSVYRIGEYIKFITQLVLVFGISFQLPVVVTILVRLDLLTARVMRATRTYAWVVILVAAAILTPPDPLTLALLAGPMIILYEICVVIASIIESRREKRELAEEMAERERMAALYAKSPDDLTEEEKAELHRAEIEQYEREHAHLYEEENFHDPDQSGDERVPYDPHGHDPYHDDPHHGHEHDESWHEDHPDWHDEHGGHDSHHGEEESFEPVQDWPDQEELQRDGMESEQAEPGIPSEVDDSTDSAESPEGGESTTHPLDAEPGEAEEAHEDDFLSGDGCEPEGPVVDVNHAPREELETLPGVDAALAQSIIDHRPYDSFDELEDVPGMGPEKMAAMISRLVIG